MEQLLGRGGGVSWLVRMGAVSWGGEGGGVMLLLELAGRAFVFGA